MTIGFAIGLVVFLTSLWVAIDAPDRGESWTWGLGCLVLWPVAFPWYLWVRSTKEPGQAVSNERGGELPPPVPAGWYGDPLGGPHRRYWDGARWTNDLDD